MKTKFKVYDFFTVNVNVIQFGINFILKIKFPLAI